MSILFYPAETKDISDFFGEADAYFLSAGFEVDFFNVF